MQDIQAVPTRRQTRRPSAPTVPGSHRSRHPADILDPAERSIQSDAAVRWRRAREADSPYHL